MRQDLVEDLQKRLRILEDKEEIRELVARYAHCATRADGEQLAAMFTEDGVFDVRSPGGESSDIRVEGRDNLLQFYSKMRPGGTTPMIHDLILELRGDAARGTCVLDSPCYTGERAGYLGYYEDDLRRVDGRWRFKARVFYFFQGSAHKT